MGMDPFETVWITGAAGRMGKALQKRLTAKKSYTILTTDKEVDIADLDAVSEFAARNRPAIVINCAGLARKDQAEIDPISAYRTNTLGARNLAIASEAVGAVIVHLSTDDLFFSGVEEPVNEFDATRPVTVYGKSKLAGENFVRELNPRHIIVRSSWVYTDLPEDVLMRAIAEGKRGHEVHIPTNQRSCPTSARTLARFVSTALKNNEFGVFHASCEGVCSRNEFVKKAFELAGLDPSLVVGSIDESGGYRIELENLMLKMTGMFTFPSWEEDLEAFMSANEMTE